MSQLPTVMPLAPESFTQLLQRAVTDKETFLFLPDELRMRAFTIAGITDANVLQATLDALRDTISKGGTLWDFKENFPEILASYRDAGREWHLNLVFRQNARQAFAVGAHAARQRNKRAFPYVEYRAGVNPRPTHKALDGKIFTVDDTFLFDHTPPWEHGCNCDLTPRTAAQVGKLAEADKSLPVEQQRVIPGNDKLQMMIDRNKLPDPERGAIAPVDLRPANQKPDGDGYSFRPDRLNQPVDLSAFDPAVRERLAGNLKALGYHLSADGLTAHPGTPPASGTALKSQKSPSDASVKVRQIDFQPLGRGEGRVSWQSGPRCLGRPAANRLGRPVSVTASRRVGKPHVSRIRSAA